MKYITMSYPSLLSIILLLGLCTLSCNSNQDPYTSQIKPPAIGKIYQINVLSDEETLASPILDSVDFNYGQAFPILPQPEPFFELRQYSVEDLDAQPILRELKCFLLLADFSQETNMTRMVEKDFRGQLDKTKAGVKIGKDKWAKDQLIVYIYAPNREALINEIERSYTTISKEIEKFYQSMIRSTVFVQGNNRAITDSIQQIFGIDMAIPADYTTALVTDSVMWLRQEIPDISRSILIFKRPYKDPKDFSREGIKALRNRVGEYISSSLPGTYMRINDIDLPLYINKLEIDGKYAVQARGIWEIVGDFMGGSFVSYAILDDVNQEIIFVDGFVYSPEKTKKLSMLYLDYILRQVKLSKDSPQ